MFGKNFLEAITQLAEEKNIDRKVVIETIEAALAAAYRKDYGEPDQNIKVTLDEKSGNFKVFDEKTVVKELDEEMEKREREFILLADAKKKKKTAKEGDVMKEEITPTDTNFGRIAAQTAKQVIIQRIREAEREAIFDEYKDKEGDVLNANVQRVEGNTIYMDLGTATGVMYPQDQIRFENYAVGQRYKVFVREVKVGPKGPEILVSRTDPGLVKKLFELEVPEIFAKTVEIKGLVREAGSRSKMAVFTEEENIDPIGSCVGQKGTRVQTVKAELGGENIDIIVWDEDPAGYITNSLAPAKVNQVKLDTENKEAMVEVD
ncbi:transcription termination factor NusA, partial [Patescibacteria group bacterium]